MAPSPQQPLSGQGVRRIPGLYQVQITNGLVQGVRRPQVEGFERRLRLCSINIGTMRGRGREVVEMLGRRKIDICCTQEVKFKGQGCKNYGTENEKYKLWWSGETTAAAGVGILVKEDLVEDVIEVERKSSRIMKIKMVLGRKILHVFSVYAPQCGRPEEEKIAFWEMLEDEVSDISENDPVIIGGDMNCHVGSDRRGVEDVMGPNGFGDRNREGEMMLEFCQSKSYRILNTMFKKENEKKITFKSGPAATQIDYILMKINNQIKAIDCKVIPGEECLTQHRMLVLTAKFQDLQRKKKYEGHKKIKEWKLKEANKKEELIARFKRELEEREDISDPWQRLKESIVSAARAVCGETSGRRQKDRETWWWNQDVQTAIQEKKKAYKSWQKSRSEEHRIEYCQKKRNAKRKVSIAKATFWEEWSVSLNRPGGAQKMFKLAKQMKKERQDVSGVKFVKDEQNNILVEKDQIMDRWRRYFQSLLNENNPYTISQVEKVEGPIKDVTIEEVQKALTKMRDYKSAGPSEITASILKSLGEEGIKELTKVFQKILKDEGCPEDWKKSITVPIYKGKGDALECGKYRGIRLLEHPMKIYERILEARLRPLVSIDERQFGFIPGKSTNDAIFIMRQMQEKFSQKKKTLFHIFVDLEKAFDRVPREVITWALRRQKIPERLIRCVMLLYEESKSQVKTATGLSGEFDVTVGVHQGSALSPLLFITVMEEVTKECRGQGPWEMLYADDLVLTALSKREVIEMFQLWKSKMEQRGLKVNITKTKCMVTGNPPQINLERGVWPCGSCGRGVGQNSILCTICLKWCHKRCSGLRRLNSVRNFVCPGCRNQNTRETEWQAAGDVLEVVDQFCYLGDMLDSEAGVDRAVQHRISVAWMKWREIASLLMNKSIPLKSRAQVYKVCIRPALLYSAENWPLTERQEATLQSCDSRMLRCMTGIRWRESIRNEEVADRCGLMILKSELRQRRLRWFGHVERSHEHGQLKNVQNMNVEGRRPRGRPKKAWINCVQADMGALHLERELALDRDSWRRAIRPSNPR